MINEVKVPSFGEELMSVDTSVVVTTPSERVKVLMAEVAEILKNNYEQERSPIKSILFDHAVGELVSAQLAVEKVLSIKGWESN